MAAVSINGLKWLAIGVLFGWYTDRAFTIIVSALYIYIYITAAAVITHRFPEKILAVPTSWVVYRPDTYYNRGEKLYYADWAVIVLLDT